MPQIQEFKFVLKEQLKASSIIMAVSTCLMIVLPIGIRWIEMLFGQASRSTVDPIPTPSFIPVILVFVLILAMGSYGQYLKLFRQFNATRKQSYSTIYQANLLNIGMLLVFGYLFETLFNLTNQTHTQIYYQAYFSDKWLGILGSLMLICLSMITMVELGIILTNLKQVLNRQVYAIVFFCLFVLFVIGSGGMLDGHNWYSNLLNILAGTRNLDGTIIKIGFWNPIIPSITLLVLITCLESVNRQFLKKMSITH